MPICPPNPPPQDVVVRPPETATPSTEGIYEIEHTVPVKTQPLPDKFEMYNVTGDPAEENNLYGMGYPEQVLLEALHVEQCEKKRLKPVSGTVPGQPRC
jgi:choline-sulfatase